MGRRQTESEAGRFTILILFLLGIISFCMVYFCLSVVFNPSSSITKTSISDLDGYGGVGDLGTEEKEEQEEEEEGKEEVCCRGIEHLELWGDAVKWGSDFKVNSSEECCMACKAMCRRDGPCSCDSWVFCGNPEACGPRFGECWLKKQKNSLEPDRRDSGDQVIWTSGLVFAKREGIVGLETEHGILRIKAPFGPPFALIQGTLEAHGTIFKEIPTEVCPIIRRGSIAWIGSGPEFFISLANHVEWKKAYTVFGSVLPEDMEIAEKISQLPTKLDVWSNISVSVLEKPVPLRFKRIETDS
ncbi:uncharacterized protein LOC107403764 isoform X2 [Ziziphus jujuba]|uniref:Uncharacterized protein LOC107403764 isoform X2 n=1 Tax=Ziziphus jujuba TaxID=326968 RepID=A0ABM4AAI1_ZIZJJ|nr:uncharacterized protein LOC107403764 isoform X2 [Ziziphus jujuba]